MSSARDWDIRSFDISMWVVMVPADNPSLWMENYSLFALTLRLEVTNDAAVFVYYTQMLSDIPLTVQFRGHIIIQRC